MAKHFFTMDESSKKQLLEYIKGIKPIDSAYIFARGIRQGHFLNGDGNDRGRNQAYRGFRQNVESVIARLPQPDRTILTEYWESSREAVEFHDRLDAPAPIFLVVPRLTNRRTNSPANAVTCRDGLVFAFEEMLAFNGPGEAIQPMIAHEIAHSLIYAKYLREGKSLPAVKPPDASMVEYLTEFQYPVGIWHEEILVDQLLSEWWYDIDLLAFWEFANRSKQKNPRQFYLAAKRGLLEVDSRLSLHP